MNNYIKVVGFGRACTPVRCAHPFFWLIYKQKGALRAPAPIAAPLHLIHPKKINKKLFYVLDSNSGRLREGFSFKQ
jgi:hypothetical protein